MKLSPPTHFFPALRDRRFALYTSGGAMCFIGFWVQRTTIGWLTWVLTESGLWLGLMAFAYLTPLVVFGPIGGTVADRWDSLRVVTICQVLSSLGALILFGLVASDSMTVVYLLILTAMQGMIETFSQTAQLALVPSLVPRKELTSAVATMSVVFNVARFVGPAIAGVVIAGPGVAVAFAVCALAFMTFLVVLLRIRRSVAPLEPRKRERFVAELLGGLRYAFRHPGIGPILMLVVSVGVAGRPVAELLPGFAADIFHSGPVGLAVLTSSTGMGSILAGLWLGGRSSSAGLSLIMLHAMLGIVAAVVAFSATSALWLAVPTLVAAGFCITSTSISAQTLINISTDSAMRGRVLSLFGVLFRGGPAIGALVMGIVSERVGLRVPVIGGAILLLGIWLRFRLHRDRWMKALEAGDQ